MRSPASWFHVSTRPAAWVRIRLAMLAVGAVLTLGAWLMIVWLLAYSD